MHKILVTLLMVSATSAFAINNDAFQEFDNQYNIGYAVSQTLLSNGAANQTLQQNQTLNLGVERLFDMGIWLDAKVTMLLATNSLGNQATGTGQGAGNTLNQNPEFAGVNVKVGYAFPLVSHYLQVIPYGLVGRNTNITAATIAANGRANVSQDVFYTGGVGARLDYPINHYIDLYADQLVSYNWDQSGPAGGIQPQNNMVYTSTLGAKFNIVKNLQLGVNGFYTNYQYLATAPSTTTINGGCPSGCSIYQPQSTVGGMVSVGLTY